MKIGYDDLVKQMERVVKYHLFHAKTAEDILSVIEITKALIQVLEESEGERFYVKIPEGSEKIVHMCWKKAKTVKGLGNWKKFKVKKDLSRCYLMDLGWKVRYIIRGLK